MTELKDEMDQALRAVTFGEAPVQRAMRDGRRLRNRRRLTVLAGAAAIVAVAAGYPALTRDAATPPPVIGRSVSPTPSHTPSPHRDPVIKLAPAVGAPDGLIAQGTIDGASWTVTFSTMHDQTAEHICYGAYLGPGSGQPEGPAQEVTMACAPNMETLVSYNAPDPAGFAAGTGNVNNSKTTYETGLGAVAPNVAYFMLSFTDGQQLKLIPVSYKGHRYVAWLTPASMTIARLTAHLGSAHADNGQTETAVPFTTPDGLPVFTLWLKPGQAVPPRASGVIGGGTQGGQVWSETAYKGPWGTCFVPSPADNGGMECVPVARIDTTEVLGGLGTGPQPVFGAAAPGVARVAIALSDGTTVTVKPVIVGDERLFAFWGAKGVAPTAWTAYDATGKKIGHGSVPR